MFLPAAAHASLSSSSIPIKFNFDTGRSAGQWAWVAMATQLGVGSDFGLDFEGLFAFRTLLELQKRGKMMEVSITLLPYSFIYGFNH